MISSIEPEEHALQASWAFTYFKKNQNKSYEDNTTTLGTVRSAEDFWRLYVHLRRPATGTGSDERTVVCDYHVFREGIKPMWEDDANRDGGKWIVRVKKGVAARIAKLEAFSSGSKLFGSAKSFDASDRSTETEEDSARSAHDEPIPPPPPVETRPRAESLQQIIERRESLPPTPDVPPPLKTRGRAMSGQI